MAKVSEIFEKLALRAPVELKMGFDNVGHLAGRGDREVRLVLVTLDITDAVIAEAKALGAELIVSHHPLTFEGLKAVTEADMTGRKFLAIIEAGMSAICMHTNLDAAAGGVNYALAEAIGARVTGILNAEEGISRLCELPEELPFRDFLNKVKTALGANGLRYAGPEKPVRKGAILMVGGAPSFPNQFLGGELVLKNLLNDLSAEFLGEVCLPNSDHDSLETRPDIAQEVKELAEKMKAANKAE